jgi:hypothetical protein
VIRLIFLRWVLVPTILLIFFCELSAPQVIVPPDPVVWMMRVFLFGMSMLMSVLPLLWASRQMHFTLVS